MAYSKQDVQTASIEEVPGAELYEQVIPEAYARELVQQIDVTPWRNTLKRRVQHYGYEYDYRARHVDASMYLGPLPAWLQRLSVYLQQQEYMGFDPDQAIVNEYLPGQGIAMHTDCEPCFHDTIVTLSLAAPCVMALQAKQQDRAPKIPLWLEPCSLLVLSGPARYDYYHGIPARKNDWFGGTKYPRQRRLSITFRQVRLGK